MSGLSRWTADFATWKKLVLCYITLEAQWRYCWLWVQRNNLKYVTQPFISPMDRKRYLPCLKEQKDSLLKSLTKLLIQVSAKYLVRKRCARKKAEAAVSWFALCHQGDTAPVAWYDDPCCTVPEWAKWAAYCAKPLTTVKTMHGFTRSIKNSFVRLKGKSAVETELCNMCMITDGAGWVLVQERLSVRLCRRMTECILIAQEGLFLWKP